MARTSPLVVVALALVIVAAVAQTTTNVTNTTAATPSPTTTTTTAAPETTTTAAATTTTTTTTTTVAPTTTTAAPTTTVAPTPSPLPAGSIRSYVFVDSTMTSMNVSLFTTVMESYISGLTIDAVSMFGSLPTIIDTKGNMLTALSQLQSIVATSSTYPDVIFVATRAAVSISINNVLKTNSTTSTIPVISIHTANTEMCDPTNNPATICLVPRDFLNVRCAIQIVAGQLSWASMAVVLSNDDYGTGVASVLSSEILAASTAPTIVTQLYIPTYTDNATDNAFIKKIVQYNPVGVLCFVKDTELLRLRNAAVRMSITNIFFIGSREALNIVSQMTGYKDALKTTSLWAALIVPQFQTAETWVTSGTVLANSVDEMGAFLISYLLDGMRLIMNARSTSISAIRSATVSGGYTGDIALDQTSFQRSSTIFRLISASYDMTRSLVTWSIASLAATSTITTNGVATSIIPTSPLLAVTVCMTAPSTCVDIANVNALLFYLLNENNNRVSNTSVSYIPVPVYTGSSGVEGLSNLIPVARSCTFLTGPGRSNVAQALTPVINEYTIPQIDYSTTSGIFTNLLQYPYFSRSVPLETFQLTAVAETASYFGWERVILISTDDTYGAQSLTAASSAMDEKTILVESSFSLSDSTNSSIAAAFASILSSSISRVIVFLISLEGDDAANFFDLVVAMGMTSTSTPYIFFLSNDLCQYGLSYPAARLALLSSICMAPYVDTTKFAAIQTTYNTSNLLSTLQETLYDGGFTGVYNCNLTTLSSYSAFALDTGAIIASVVSRAQTAGIALTKKSSLLPLVRATSLTTWTGTFSIDSSGDRDYAAYVMNIQTPSGLVTFAKWDSKATVTFVYDSTVTITWFGNTTTVPSATYRSISFIAESTVSTNPGTIVLSVLGFAGTIAVFFFCYRHYKMQRLIELSLEAGTFPVGMKQDNINRDLA
eukprot:CAMPEP_0176436782 /NCGR_PEP_ID=MMETSP0127-20121128/18190_1 /TAXON_ID=938130 /ORGANISM="Platyophrya macrostoma, Strain WH" /LENGTH=944 /DNA_ID=CAMNT_0017820201 /DNA_START=90 /DNA_END=2924 /DNA_ORIENTATION=-